MKRIRAFLQIFLMVAVAASIARPQGNFICLAGFQAHAPDFVVRAGISASFQVDFRVVDFRAEDIHVLGADSLSRTLLELFNVSTIDNIQRITFLKDTSRAHLTVSYSVLDPRLVSHSYVEAVSDDEIRIVFRRSGLSTYDPTVATSDDSVWIRGTIDFKPGSQHPSDILVRLYVGASGDSVAILRNSHPDRTNDILAAARRIQKADFPSRLPEWTGYFVRFRVARDLRDCDFYEQY